MIVYFLDCIKIPKIIVVANALTSDIMNNTKFFKINKENFNSNGYHVITINNREIPIFFTSMLTQQRALDKYSRERLIWE